MIFLSQLHSLITRFSFSRPRREATSWDFSRSAQTSIHFCAKETKQRNAVLPHAMLERNWGERKAQEREKKEFFCKHLHTNQFRVDFLSAATFENQKINLKKREKRACNEDHGHGGSCLAQLTSFLISLFVWRAAVISAWWSLWLAMGQLRLSLSLFRWEFQGDVMKVFI